MISTHLLRQDVSDVGAHARARVKEYTGNVRITAVLESNRRHGRSSSREGLLVERNEASAALPWRLRWVSLPSTADTAPCDYLDYGKASS